MADDKPLTAKEAAVLIRRYVRLLTEMYNRISRNDARVDDRRFLVLAHIRKTQQIARACLHLQTRSFVEEIFSLSRTLAEVVTNCAYLQIAELKEIDRYLLFDSSDSLRKTKKVLKHDPLAGSISAERLQKAEEAAAEYVRITGRGDKDRVWSQYCGIENRASQVDKYLGVPITQTLVTQGALWGDSAVHGTMASLKWFVNGIGRRNDAPSEERLDDLALALTGVVRSLATLSFGLDILFELGMEAQVTGAEERPVDQS